MVVIGIVVALVVLPPPVTVMPPDVVVPLAVVPLPLATVVLFSPVVVAKKRPNFYQPDLDSA